MTVLNGTTLEKTSVKLTVLTKPLTSSADIVIDIQVSSTATAPQKPGSLLFYVDGAVKPTSGWTTVAGQSESHATASIGRLPVGTHVVTAVFVGDDTHAGSTKEIDLQIKK